PIALITGGAMTVGGSLRKRLVLRRSLSAPLVTLLVVYATTVLVGYPALERTRPVVFAARFLRSHSTDSTPVGLYRLGRWRARRRYYLGRRVVRLDDPDDVRRFLDSAQPSFVVMLRDEYETLQATRIPLELMSARSAVSATTGRVFRRQLWNQLVIVRGSAS